MNREMRRKADAEFRRKLGDIDTRSLALKAAELVHERMTNDGLSEARTQQLTMIKEELERRGHSFAEADRLNALADALEAPDVD